MWRQLYVCRVPLILSLAIALLGWQVEQIHEIVRVYIIDTGTIGFRLQSWSNLAACYVLLSLLTMSIVAWSRYALVNRYPAPLAHNGILRASFELLPIVLAALPWVGALLAVWGAREGLTDEHESKVYLLLAAILVFAFTAQLSAHGFTGYRGIDHIGQGPAMDRYVHRMFLWFSVGFGVSFFGLAAQDPWWAGRWFGTIAILLAAALSVLPFLVLLTSSPRSPRWHWLSLIVALALLFSTFDLNDNHPVRALEVQSGFAAGASHGQEKPRALVPTVSVHEAFEQWLEARPSTKPEEALPVVLIAAEGGGIRAAYFTALVLATLQDRCPAFARHVFAISSVSGGSVGAAVFQALVADEVAKRKPGTAPLPPSDCPLDEGDAASGRTDPGPLVQAVEHVLREDLLAPLSASLLFTDALQRLLFWPIDRWDRAVTLEQTLERAYAAATGSIALEGSLYSSWDPRSDAPLILFNTTLVSTGERVIVTPVMLLDERFHRVKTLTDLAPNTDLRVSTAAMLSARFTYMTPAAYIGGRGYKLRLVDGGYFENSGAATLDEMLAFVSYWAAHSKRKVAPIVIRIGNTPIAKADPARQPHSPDVALGELLSPLRAMLATREARGELAAEALKSRVTGMLDEDHCAEFIEFQIDADRAALPLGWQLSQAARKGLQRQFDTWPACDSRQGVVNACSARDVVLALKRAPAACTVAPQSASTGSSR